jgi:hypothetical protein
MSVDTHPHLLVVGVSNNITVPCLARLGTRRGETGGSDPRDKQLSGSLGTEGFYKYYRYTIVKRPPAA